MVYHRLKPQFEKLAVFRKAGEESGSLKLTSTGVITPASESRGAD
jgi:hypothetical protein